MFNGTNISQMFPYQRLLAGFFGLVGVLLLFLMIKLYQDQKPPPEGDDKGKIVSLISTVTLIDNNNFKVAEELSFSLEKPVPEINRHFPKEIAHNLGIQIQDVTFEKALDLVSFNEIELIKRDNGVSLKYPFSGNGGYRLDYTVSSQALIVDGISNFYFKQAHELPILVPSAKIVVRFLEKPAQVKGFIETAEKRAMVGTTPSGAEIKTYLSVVDEAGARVSETEAGFEIVNTRPLLPGESLVVMAVL